VAQRDARHPEHTFPWDGALVRRRLAALIDWRRSSTGGAHRRTTRGDGVDGGVEIEAVAIPLRQRDVRVEREAASLGGAGTIVNVSASVADSDASAEASDVAGARSASGGRMGESRRIAVSCLAFMRPRRRGCGVDIVGGAREELLADGLQGLPDALGLVGVEAQLDAHHAVGHVAPGDEATLGVEPPETIALAATLERPELAA
jgi:hypothetical protein